MKIVFLDVKTIGDDIDLSGFDALGEVVKYDFSTAEQARERTKDADVIILNQGIQLRTLEGPAAAPPGLVLVHHQPVIFPADQQTLPGEVQIIDDQNGFKVVSIQHHHGVPIGMGLHCDPAGGQELPDVLAIVLGQKFGVGNQAAL